MIGLTLAVIYSLALVAFGKKWEEAYISSTRFMTYWSVITVLLIGAVWVFVISSGGLLGGLLTGTGLGAFLALVGFGLIASGTFFVVLALAVLQALGAYLMSTAVSVQAGALPVYEWKKERLVIGALFFVVGLTKFVG